MAKKISFILFQAVFLFALIGTTAAQNLSIKSGAENTSKYLLLLKGRRVAVFANQTSMAGDIHLVDMLLSKNINIVKIFSPEHGFRGNADAGEKVQSIVDNKTGLTIVSLYGTKNKPSAEDLADVDVMLFDIQDVGTRFFTYISSLQGYIESAVANDKKLIVLDRPNPNGDYVDGPVLDKKFKSFVGMQSVPVVYGMTIGEYGKMLVGEKWLDATVLPKLKNAKKKFSMTVVPCINYTHKSKYQLPVKPSPNLPNMQSVILYPSICFFEGTDISLGRGTNKPFQIYGAPSFPATSFSFTPRSVEGAKNPPLLNQLCNGYDLSKIDAVKEMNGRLQLKWLLHAYKIFPDKNKFFLANNFINKLAGNDMLAQQIKDGKTEAEIRASWQPGLTAFKAIRKKYLIYQDF